MKKKIISWLLLGSILSPFSVVSLANDVEKTDVQSTTDTSVQSDEAIQSQDSTIANLERDTEATGTTETTENDKENTGTTVSSEQEQEQNGSIEETDNYSVEEDAAEILEDEDYRYPSNRSDLDSPSESSPEKSYSRVLNQNLSITNSNLPKSSFIDVSSHNGDISINSYKIMKKYGVTGVVVKLTEGTSYRNPYAKKQIANAKSAGLVVSVYHFSRFATAQKAREEANYFSAVARELGLPKTTVMVNDLESSELTFLGNNANTNNALTFANQLKANGYSTVRHYLGLYWINENRISASRLGYSNIWVAAYPINLTKTQLNTGYGAWQWSDQMTFPGVNGKFDISSDYTKVYSTPAEGNYIPDGRYVSITSKGYNVWRNFNFNSSNLKTSSIYQKTYLAKGRYEHSNGSTYYSLYTGDGTWVGYLNSSATKTAPDKNGSYISDGRYVTVNKRGYNTWNGFDWVTRNSSDKVYLKTYLAKGRYENVNGSTYLSLYDDKGRWQGYINASAVGFASGPQGIYMKQNSYASISNDETSLFNDFNGTIKIGTKAIYQNNYYLSASYHHIDGTVYYSLYDDSDKWVGYAKANDVEVTNERNGPYIPYGKYIDVVSKNYPIWQNFSWVKRTDARAYYGRIVMAKGLYKHVNGEVYYSLYDDNNTWLGYINSRATKAAKQNGENQTTAN